MIPYVMNDDNTILIIDYTPIFNRSDETAARYDMNLLMFALSQMPPLYEHLLLLSEDARQRGRPLVQGRVSGPH